MEGFCEPVDVGPALEADLEPPARTGGINTEVVVAWVVGVRGMRIRGILCKALAARRETVELPELEEAWEQPLGAIGSIFE